MDGGDRNNPRGLGRRWSLHLNGPVRSPSPLPSPSGRGELSAGLRDGEYGSWRMGDARAARTEWRAPPGFAIANIGAARQRPPYQKKKGGNMRKRPKRTTKDNLLLSKKAEKDNLGQKRTRKDNGKKLRTIPMGQKLKFGKQKAGKMEVRAAFRSGGPLGRGRVGDKGTVRVSFRRWPGRRTCCGSGSRAPGRPVKKMNRFVAFFGGNFIVGFDCNTGMNNPVQPGPAWDIEAARTLYNIQRWGAKYFDINEAGHVVATPLQERRGRRGPHGRDRGGARARPEVPAADPVSGHFAPPGGGHQPGVPQFHRRIQFPGQIPRRVSHQGQPAPRGGGGDFGRGEGVRVRAGGGQQAGTVRRAWRCKTSRAAW